MTIRIFHLERTEDHSGVSGTGKVAEGIEFSDGTCALRWLSKLSSTAIYPNIKILEAVHGHGGKTKIVWDEPGLDRGSEMALRFLLNEYIKGYDQFKEENEQLKKQLAKARGKSNGKK